MSDRETGRVATATATAAATGTPTAPGSTGASPAPPHTPPTPNVARSGGWVLAMRLLTLMLGCGLSMVLARWLGAAGLGVYETAMGWAALLAVPACLGAEVLVVREVAAAHAQGKAGLVRSLADASTYVVLVCAGLVAISAFLASLLLGERAPAGLLIVGCGIVPLGALLRVRQAVLRGLAHVVKSQVGELLLVPAIALALLFAVANWQGSLTPHAALGCQAVALAVALIAVFAMTRRSTPAEVQMAQPTGEVRLFGRALVPLAIVAGLQALNTRLDVVMLGALALDADVGRYAAANRLAGLIAMPLFAVNAALAPAFARLHAAGDHHGLQGTVTRAAWLSFAVALPTGLGLLLFGDEALGLFGDEFVRADTELRLLSTAQLVNVGIGSVGLLLMMTGHMRAALLGLAAGALTNAVLNALLIPELGSLGAAVATGTSLVVWNVVQGISVWRRLGVMPGILAPWRRRTR